MKLIDILVRELPKRGGWPDAVGFAVQHNGGNTHFTKSMPSKVAKIWGHAVSHCDVQMHLQEASDSNENLVTREQYEAALIETKQPKTTWKYIKGSEKDFVCAPSNETHAFMHKECCHFIYTSNPEDIRADLFLFIAQREPVAEWVDGLPSVGAECEFRKHSRGINSWIKVKVMYMSEFTAVMRELEDGASGEEIHHPQTLEFRPLRTEEDKKLDEAIDSFIRELIQYVDFSSPMVDGKEKIVSKLYELLPALPGVKLED